MNKQILLAAAMAWSLEGQAQGSNQIPAPPQSTTIALVGGTVHTVSGADIEGGTVVFEQGKITVVGKGASIPRGATVIDVTGKQVYPGLIDAYTSIGLSEVGSVRGTVDQSEVGRINPNVRAEVAVNPESEIIPVTRANGTALAVTAPSGGTLSGRSALLRLDGWTWEDMTFKAPLALQVNWPDMTLSVSRFSRRSEEDQRKDREQSLAALDDAFGNAKAYLQARSAGSGVAGPSDLRWEAMAKAFSGELPVMVVANSIQEIEGAVGWATEFGLRLIIVGGADAWRLTDLLFDKKVPVIVAGSHRLPSRRMDPYDAPYALAAKLYEAGVKFCISSVSYDGSGEASNARNLPYEAATAAAYGLPKDEALKSITLYSAQILGVADRVGSIEVGKDATLIVTDGDPLEIATHVEKMYIEGRQIDLSSRHTQLYEKYKLKYSRK